MLLIEAIERLQAEGVPNSRLFTAYHVYRVGYLPTPARDRSFRFRLTEDDVDRLRQFLPTVQRPGRRASKQCQEEVCGA